MKRKKLEEKVDETLIANIPFKAGLAAAFFKISLISSTEVFLLATKVMSASEPQTIGVLMAMPSNLPSKSFKTRVTAKAAPVV